MTKLRILVVLLGAIALILVILALQLMAPGDVIQQTGSDNATIVFSSDQRMLLAPGACLTVRWDVESIQGVYINGDRTVGQSSKQMCVDETTMPVLTVKFKDNTSTDYPLNILFLVEQPSTWLLVSAAILLVLISLGVALSRPTSAAPKATARCTPRIVFLFAGIGMLVSAVTVLGIILELCLRLYFGQFGSREEQEAYLDTRAQIDARESLKITLPYVEFGLSPDYPGQNKLGYRGDDIQVPKPSGTYRIVALGDSSTYGSLVPYDQTYPYDLQQVLRDNYGYKNVEVVNGGVPNYSSWNLLVDLAFRVAVLQPDLVIIYDGWNDLDAREQSPDCFSGNTPFLGLDAMHTVRADLPELSSSALYRFVWIHLGWMPNPAQEDSDSVPSRIGCSPQVESQIPQNLTTNSSMYFQRNQRDMAALAKANGYQIMFMTWAYDTSDSDVPEYRRPALAENNSITKQIAQEGNLLLFDYAAIAQSGNALWADGRHQNPRGNMIQAQAIAQYLVGQHVIPESDKSTS